MITNCGVTGTVSINGWHYPIGGLAGENYGTITNCFFDGTVGSDDDFCGGLVGWDEGSIISCHTTGTVSGDDEVGGLVGCKVGGDIKDSYSECAVEGVNSDSTQTGGLVGINDGEIDGCCALGPVTGALYVGGLVGYNYSSNGIITNSYASGPVSATNYIGGLAGENNNSITNCYSMGAVTVAPGGTDAGGLVGVRGGDGSAIKSYWNSETTLMSASAGGEGKTTNEMKQISTYEDWNFDTIWGINDSDNNGYPFLRWQGYDDGEPSVPPVLSAVSAGSVTRTTATLSFSSDKAGDYYFLVYLAEVSAPDAAMIKAQGEAAAKGTGTAGTENSVAVSGLTASTAYKAYIIVEDDQNNNSDVAMISFTTTAGETPVYTLSITAGTGGSVIGDPGGNYAADTVINIAAEPSSGYVFGRWSSVGGGTFGSENSAVTTFIMPANTVTITAVFRYIDLGEDDGGVAPPPPLSYKAKVTAENDTQTELTVTVDKNTGTAALETDFQDFAPRGTVITIPSIPDVSSYSAAIPVPGLTKAVVQGTLTLHTGAGSITIPSNMLSGSADTGGNKAQITIGRGESSSLPKDVREAIGDRPIIQLTLSIDGRQTEWSNPEAPVTVSVPYTPTAEELLDPESIVVWYIDSSGNAVSIPNGHYDPETGTVTFNATHFSYYAVSYNRTAFNDVAYDAWYAKAVSFITAREIAIGTVEDYFRPDAKLKRGELIVMLLKAYGISPDPEPNNNFADAGDTYYTGFLSAAKRLGITKGTGNNMFMPEKEISRQEMFALLYNVINVIGQLPQSGSEKTLSDFSDAVQIDPWAKEAVKLLVETGIIGGSNGNLFPLSTTTKAEAAQVLYNLLGK